MGWARLLGYGCGYLGAVFVCRYHGTSFIYRRKIWTNKIYPINAKKSNQGLSICCRTRIIDILVTIVISYM